MKYSFYVLFITIIGAANCAAADNVVGFTPLVNEVSIYQNSSDKVGNLGQTLQIVSINTFKIWTSFNVEFAADFNRRLTPGTNKEFYLEIGILKPVWKNLSVNYQRVHGTFVCEPVNQFGVRWGF